MFDDCNTFFKGKPDGRDESRTGRTRDGRECDARHPSGGVATRRLRNSYTPPILAGHSVPKSPRPKVSRGPRRILWAEYGPPQSAWDGPAPIAPKDWKRAAVAARKAKGRPELSAVAHRTKVSCEGTFPRETFVRPVTFSRSSPRRTPSTRPAWRRASDGRSRTSRPCPGSPSRGSP